MSVVFARMASAKASPVLSVSLDPQASNLNDWRLLLFLIAFARPTPVTELLSNFLSFSEFEPFYQAMRQRAEIMALYDRAESVEASVCIAQS